MRQADIFFDGVVENIGLLRDVRHIVTQAGGINVRQRFAVNTDLPLLRVVKTH